MALDRRQLLAAATSYFLVRGLAASDAVAGGQPADLHTWLRQLGERCRDLRHSRIGPERWLEQVEALYHRTPLDELLAASDPSSLQAMLDQRPAAGIGLPVGFPELEGMRDCATAVFALPAGTAIPPHGHRNLVAAHVVLQGELRIRQYDRVLDLPGAALLRPRGDLLARRGDVSSVSDGPGNVHWFVAMKGPAYTFDVTVSR